MRYSFAKFVTLAVVVMSAARCAGDLTAPTSPSAGNGTTSIVASQIAGTWTLSSIQPAGEAERSVPSGAGYTLTFADDRVSTKADCNTCSGPLVIGDQSLTIGPVLACTRAACPTMEFENTYVGIIAGASAARIEGASLTLTSSRGIARFSR